jgi:hypothetical protein
MTCHLDRSRGSEEEAAGNERRLQKDGSLPTGGKIQYLDGEENMLFIEI